MQAALSSPVLIVPSLFLVPPFLHVDPLVPLPLQLAVFPFIPLLPGFCLSCLHPKPETRDIMALNNFGNIMNS